MADVFISYSSHDGQFADRLYQYLSSQGFSTWYAPLAIEPSDDFAQRISSALSDDDIDIELQVTNEAAARIVILLLSKNSMNSIWVPKEVKYAMNQGIFLLAVHVDHSTLTPQFSFLLTDVQIVEGYHLGKAALDKIVSVVSEHVPKGAKLPQGDTPRYSLDELGIDVIASGDPYYVEGETLSITLSDEEFFLAPPQAASIARDEDLLDWVRNHHFSEVDRVFRDGLDKLCTAIAIPDLRERIERSREKVFAQFRNQENGCYFNNKKYGISNINPFGRTEDESELPMLTLTMFTTDYFTHRVMKDVCKQLVSEGSRQLKDIDFAHIGPNKIFLTSLGVNLLVLDNPSVGNRATIIASRSTNSAETYGKQTFSLSVIEGVSISDYDAYLRQVRPSFTVERGIMEELGIEPALLQLDTVRFYDLFVNRSNLEIGLSCSIELRDTVTIDNTLLCLRGKDDALEVADKRILHLSDLESFARINREAILPQAFFALCSIMESMGSTMIDRRRIKGLLHESFVQGKDGTSLPCGDAVIESDHFAAVIDGATPKGTMLWDGQPGDAFIARILSQTVLALSPDISAAEAIDQLNRRVSEEYEAHGMRLESMQPEERLQASVLIYSKQRKEVWCFGDCQLRINQKNYRHQKKVDDMLSDLRAFCVEAERLQGNDVDLSEHDVGRDYILPFLKMQSLFANSDMSFGYQVIDGGEIIPGNVTIYSVQTGDHVVLASDGYPKLFDTLEETESYLHSVLERDPNCLYLIRGTKSIKKGYASYDDRCFLSFTV